MSGTAGIAGDVQVSVDDTTYHDVSGLMDVDINMMRELVETTSFNDTARDRTATIRDSNATLGVHYSTTDPNATGAINTALDNGTVIYVRWRIDGTNGFKLQCKVASLNLSSAPDAVVDGSYDLQGVAAWATV